MQDAQTPHFRIWLAGVTQCMSEEKCWGCPILNPEEGSSSSDSLAEVTWTLVGESSRVAQNETI